MARSFRVILRESASAAAELRPVTDVEHPSSITGFTSKRRAPADNVSFDLRVMKALPLLSEKTQ